MHGSRAAVAEQVEQFDPSLHHPHAEVSLGKLTEP